MKQRIFLAVAAIGAGVALAVFAQRLASSSTDASNSTTLNSDTANEQSETGNANFTPPPARVSAQVNVTAEGFSPNPVVVTKGSTVIWMNSDSKIHVIAPGDPSAPARYQGVWDDQSGILSQGATYAHTFLTTGSFEYYDAMMPSLVGTVVVRD